MTTTSCGPSPGRRLRFTGLAIAIFLSAAGCDSTTPGANSNADASGVAGIGGGAAGGTGGGAAGTAGPINLDSFRSGLQANGSITYVRQK